MTTALATQPTTASAVELALIGGDLAQLKPSERLAYYNQLCASLDLNPLTKPFEYITLNGKLTLYARKDCTEQLRSKRHISVTIKAREVVEGCYIVTAQARNDKGREDESIGAVPIEGLKGENRANAMMKAETKAKRRVTLSICGLGMLDETEIESIPSASYTVSAPAVPALPAISANGPAASAPNAGDSGTSQTSNALSSGNSAGSGETLDVSVPNTGDSGQLRGTSALIFTGYRISTFSKPSGDKIKGVVTLLYGPTGQIMRDDFAIYNEQLATLAEGFCQDRVAVNVEFKTAKGSGKTYIVGLTKVPTERVIDIEHFEPVPDDSEVPF